MSVYKFITLLGSVNYVPENGTLQNRIQIKKVSHWLLLLKHYYFFSILALKMDVYEIELTNFYHS